MTLTQEPTIMPIDWEAFEIKFYVPNPDIVPNEVQSGGLSVLIWKSDGSKVERGFNLLERLADDIDGQDVHLPALAALKTYITGRVESEILNE